jgi:hypothetical protein
MMQLTTIKGMNNPKDWSKAGKKAFSNIPTMVTKVAMTTTKAGIRILSGITFFNMAMATLEPINTIVVDKPIPTPLMADVVTAKVGHMPNTKRKIGFSGMMPLNKFFPKFMILHLRLTC